MLKNIFELISTLFDLFIDVTFIGFKLLGDLITIIDLVLSVWADIPDYLTWLPPEAMAIITVTFLVVVFYKIFNRT